MGYTIKQIQASLKRISKIKPNNPNAKSDLSLREAILFMAPKLLEKKAEGLSISQLAQELAGDKIEISAPTLNRYLNQYQAKQKDQSKSVLPYASEKSGTVRAEKSVPSPTSHTGIKISQSSLSASLYEEKI